MICGAAGWAGAQRVAVQLRFVARLRISPVGLVVAVLLVCVSLTPSLLPRTWLAQGVISGVSGSIGYGLGVTVAWLWRQTMPVRWQPAGRLRRWLIGIVLSAAAVLLSLSLYFGSIWQRGLYRLIGEPPPGRLGYVRVLFITLLMVVVAVGLTRGVLAFGRWVKGLARRRIPELPANMVGVAVVGLLGVVLIDGVLQDGVLTYASYASSEVNSSTGPATSRPESATRSGSPQSLVAWESLGREGRSFVAGGSTAAQIAEFTGQPAKEPIRVYVGLDASPVNSAEQAVRELERTGAADRAVLCVVTTTGTGWVDPYAAAALEYMFGGDTAIVGTQFSYLPSWISFVSEQERSAQAGRALFDRVHAYWSTLPSQHRPRLVVFGESLGSLGSEAAFGDLDDVRRRTDGALWLGPTNTNPLWRTLEAGRDPGSPEVLPVYGQGAAVRFASRPEDLDRPAGPWPPPRVVYAQNPSDPVTWWSPRLLLAEPDWLKERPGYDVQPAIRWYPVVTFLQLSADLALAQRARVAHGHYFRAVTVAAWAAVTQPPGWSPARSAELTSLLDRLIPIE
jgi:uncharacterized membrane protein